MPEQRRADPTVGGVEHDLTAAVEGLGKALDVLSGVELWRSVDTSLLTNLSVLAQQLTRAEAVRLRLIREVDQRGATLGHGATSTAGWLGAVTGARPGTARRDMILATALADRYARLRAAVTAGVVTTDAATVIVRALDALSAEARTTLMPRDSGDLMPRDGGEVEVPGGATVLDWAESFLVEKAGICDPVQLARLGQHVHATIDPDAGGRLAEDERKQILGRELRLTPDASGGLLLRGRVDQETGAMLRAALDAFAAPHPEDADGGRDLRTPAQRNGDALAQLVEGVLDGGGLPTSGGHRPHLSLTLPYATLAAGLTALGRAIGEVDPADGSGLPQTDWGTMLSPAAVRRMACDAQIIPIVLGAQSEPLDVGRASYPATVAIRRALVTRDQGCAFPGCGRPPSWTHAHHIHHWADGGATELDNLVLLCGHHHRLIHHSGWDVRIGDDGHPEFLPPRWVDPTRTPRPVDRRRQHHGLTTTGNDPPVVVES